MAALIAAIVVVPIASVFILRWAQPAAQAAPIVAADAVDPILVSEAMRARESSIALSAGVVDLLTTAESTTEHAASAATAAARVRDDAQTIAAGAEEMSATVREIATTTGDAARLAGEAAGLAADAEQAVRRLGDSSRGIGDVVEAISAIADQTNLLALNATIEAARAGPAGRGFAVVAGEVKNLAHQTADATADVGRRIAAIQADTAAAIAAIAAITTRIARIHEVQQTVAAAVEEQSATTQEMSRTIGGTAQGAAAIATNIANVADEARRAAMATVVVRDLAHTAVASGEETLRRVDPTIGTADGHGVPADLFDRVIRAHVGWRTRLLEAIEGGSVPDRAKAVDHTACELGRCLIAQQAALSRHPSYGDLVEQHRMFHQEVGVVIDLVAAKRLDQARAAIATGGFAQTSERTLGLIARLKPLGSAHRPVSLEWSPDYATGVAQIDAQHRELFAKVATLHAAMMSGAGRSKLAELVGFLADYTVKHFADEEGLMERAGYPGLGDHRALHRDLLAQVSALRGKIDAGEPVKTMEVTDFLAGWLRHHILKVDHDYVPSMRSAGLGA